MDTACGRSIGFCRNYGVTSRPGYGCNLKLNMKIKIIALVLNIFALSAIAQAVAPAPDGGYPGGNTAEGQAALFSLTTGSYNTAVGFLSLNSDMAGQFNTAIGAGALLANAGDPSRFRGIENTATGAGALLSNSTGTGNTANGAFTLFNNTIGAQSVANGAFALVSNTTGTSNTAIGYAALNENTTGNFNVALGNSAGLLASGSSNVYIGTGMLGVPGESNACYIASIFGQTSVGGIPVLVNSDNKLGTTSSSKRFKEDISPMDKASEAILAFQPVTFRYKKEIDPRGAPQFGLVAEEVEKVNPDLVVRDKEGKPYSVRYDQVNAMLLNEFLKAHRKMEDQQKQIEAVTVQLKQQAAQLQKVSDQVEINGPLTKVVVNKP